MISANKAFSVKSCYDILNDGRVRSIFRNSIWKSIAPFKIKVFAWLVVHDKILSIANLNKRGWSGPIYCEACGYDTETTSHIFLHCPVPFAIWNFLLLNANYQWDRINISEIFSFFHLLKFNIKRHG